MIQLQAFRAETDPAKHDKKILDGLKKRKLVSIAVAKSYFVTKGDKFKPLKQKLEINLTAEMLRTGSWRETEFKRPNLNAAGQGSNGGHLHPLLKVRSQFRETLLEMGFNEMPTNRFVESSFWNFDSLF